MLFWNISSPRPFPSSFIIIPMKQLICFLSLYISLHILEFYINRIIQNVHTLASFAKHNYFKNHPCSFHLILRNITLCGYSAICLFIKQLMDVYLGCSQFGADTNKDAISINMHAFVWKYFISLGQILGVK